jgi:hypothetical protein
MSAKIVEKRWPRMEAISIHGGAVGRNTIGFCVVPALTNMTSNPNLGAEGLREVMSEEFRLSISKDAIMMKDQSSRIAEHGISVTVSLVT